MLHDAESCRWCGETIRGRLSRRATAGLVATLALLLVGGGTMMFARSGDVVTLLAPSSASGPVSASEAPAPAPAARSALSSSPRAAGASSRADAPSSSAPSPAAPPQPSPSGDETEAAAQDPVNDPVPDGDRPADPAADQRDAPADETGWVRAVARTFVNVRSAPASNSSVQGVVA
ncbi:MAG: hypothetical protein EA350_02370, partial [Gemmatimonadales bacterium]